MCIRDSGIGVSQHVRRRRVDACESAVFYNETANVRSQERAAAPGEQQSASCAGTRVTLAVHGEKAAAALQIAAQRRGGLLAHRHDAGLAALAVHDQLGLPRLDVAQLEPDHLLTAQALS